jgi:asparagine synthase (glutamine-hydrolysing)
MDVVEYAWRIPVSLKLRRSDNVTEKWILRSALTGILPNEVLWRQKAKFWQGAGVRELVSDHANSVISDADFARERVLPNGWELGSKEELLYYRIFRQQFGELDSLAWMGRTESVPTPAADKRPARGKDLRRLDQ